MSRRVHAQFIVDKGDGRMQEFLVLHRMGVFYRMALVHAETTDDAIETAEQYLSRIDLGSITEIRSIPVSAMVETVRELA